MTPPVVAILLAGGLARRMGGGDKPLRLLAGRTLLDHALARILPQVRAVALNANGDPGRFAQWRLPVVADPLDGNPGPLAGVLAGMRWAAAAHPDCTDVVSVPTDTPFLPHDLVSRLQAARAAAGQPLACAASEGRTHPVVGLWPVSLADALDAALRDGMRRIDAWTGRIGIAHAAFEATDGDPFLNLNTTDDLRAAEALLARN